MKSMIGEAEVADPGQNFDIESVWCDLKQRVSQRAVARTAGASPREMRADIVVESLRMGLPSELVYWQLRQFAQATRNDPTIATDRGKYLYVDFDSTTRDVTLYVGTELNHAVFSGCDSKKYFALSVCERYIYRYVEAFKSVLRIPATSESLVKEISPYTNPENRSQPLLVYSTCNAGEGRSRCCLTLGGHKTAAQ